MSSRSRLEALLAENEKLWDSLRRRRRKDKSNTFKVVSVDRPVRVRLQPGMARPSVRIDGTDGALVLDFTS